MDHKIIKNALYSALNLLNQEVESVEMPELSDDYLRVIGKVEDALKEFPGGR